MTIDCFSAENIPDELKNILNCPPQTMIDKVKSLFLLKEELTLNELKIGLYKKYNILVRRNSLFSALSDLQKKNFLERIGNSCYRLKE